MRSRCRSMHRKPGSNFMLKHGLLTILFTLTLPRVVASAQVLCPVGVTSDNLICLVTQSIGVSGSLTVGRPSSGGLQVGNNPFALGGLDHSLKALTSSAAE